MPWPAPGPKPVLAKGWRVAVKGEPGSKAEGRRLLAKNTAAQYALQAAKYLFPFVTVAYLTRVLGPDIYAVRAYVLAAMSLMLVFLNWGFMNYGTKAIAEAGSIDEQSRITSVISILRVALCVVGAIILVPITLAVPIMAAWPLYVAFAYIGTCFKALLPDFVFQGQEDMGIITYRYVASQVVAVGLIVLLVKTPGDLLLVPVLEALGGLIALVWSWENVWRVRHIRFAVPGRRLMREAFSQSGIFFVSSAATTILSSFTTLFIGFYIEDRAQISYWSLAMTAVTAIQALYAPIQNSLYPHMVKRRDYQLMRKLLYTGTAAALAGSLVFAYFDWAVVLVLGGEAFLPGAYVLALVAPVLVFSYPVILLGVPGLAAIGRVRELAASSVAGALFQVAGLVLLLVGGCFTIENVAVLRCLSELVICIIRWAMYRRFSRPANEEGTGYAL